MLHLTKVAFGCTGLDDLDQRISAYAPGSVRLSTRYRPKRHTEIVGGSLFWIFRHRLIARSQILGFEDSEGGRTDIVLEARVIPVVAIPKRAHQGWRYFEPEKAPRDLVEGEGADELPAALVGDLVALGLI